MGIASWEERMKKSKGRPAGEVQVGEGFDEMLKRLGEIYEEKGWSFTSEDKGAINAELLTGLGTEQEADRKADTEAWNKYILIHGPIMARQGERGAVYSRALEFARTASKGNRELLKILGELKIRSGRKKKTPEKRGDE